MARHKREGRIIRLNIGLSPSAYKEVCIAQRALGSPSITDAIRRSARITNKVMKFQGGDRKVILRDGNTETQLVIL